MVKFVDKLVESVNQNNDLGDRKGTEIITPTSSSFKERFGLALFTGLMLGLVTGIIESTYKIFDLIFDWYEFYQIFLFALFLFSLIFLVIGLLLEIVLRISRIKVSKEKLTVFYFVTALYLLPLIYATIYINLVRVRSALLAPASIITNLLLFILFLILVTVTFIIGGNHIETFLKFLTKWKVKETVQNILLFVVLFILISLTLDLYTTPKWDKTPQQESEGQKTPNIILISIDTVRASDLSLYGYFRNTSPNIDEFAKNAMVFENAISASSTSLTSHASLFTGKYPFRHNAIATHQKLDSNQLTLTEILKENGYSTAAFTSAGFLTAKFGLGQGFETFNDRLDLFNRPAYLVTILQLLSFMPVNPLYVDGTRTAEEINKDVFFWLERHRQQKFFLFLHYFDAHDPYIPNSEILKRFSDSQYSYSTVQAALAKHRYDPIDSNIINYMVALYDAEIFYLDKNLGELFGKLKEFGLLNNTAIIIVGDHGEEFYEHGGFTHGGTLYQEVIHVPLIIYYPQTLPGQRVKNRVETLNLFSTVLDLTGIKELQGTDSISLIPFAKNNSVKRNYTFSQISGREYLGETNQDALIEGNWKLIEVYTKDETLPPSLFNLAEDPYEKENLYNLETEKREQLMQKIMEIKRT